MPLTFLAFSSAVKDVDTARENASGNLILDMLSAGEAGESVEHITLVMYSVQLSASPKVPY